MEEKIFEYEHFKDIGIKDGDTITAHIDLGFGVTIFETFRILDLDTHELHDKDPIKRALAQVAKDLGQMMLSIETVDRIMTKKAKTKEEQERCKYGRFLCLIWFRWEGRVLDWGHVLRICGLDKNQQVDPEKIKALPMSLKQAISERRRAIGLPELI